MNVVYRNPIIIVVAGKARSGKNTICNKLKELFEKDNQKVIISPYTKYLKEYIKDITGKNFTEDNKPRELLQQLGIEIIKDKLGKKDLFITRQLDDIDIYSYFFDVILIPDARFPKEIEILKEKYRHVVSIKVVRNKESNMTTTQKEHITETALDHYDDSHFDYMIHNDDVSSLNHTIEDIYQKINAIQI